MDELLGEEVQHGRLLYPCDRPEGLQRHSSPEAHAGLHLRKPRRGLEHEGKFFTVSWLGYYLRYAYVSRHLDLSNKIIVEIGSGSAKQAHLLKMAHPDATILIFDIPPQIYVANQYLKAVLKPDELVPFEKARSIKDFSHIERGRLHVFGNWHIDILRGAPFDLLWNAASFQEMEPDVVRHYIDAARGARDVYLMQAMAGQAVAPAPGRGGVIEATTIETYRSALPNHEMVDEAPAYLAMPVQPEIWPYTETFWKGRANVDATGDSRPADSIVS